MFVRLVGVLGTIFAPAPQSILPLLKIVSGDWQCVELECVGSVEKQGTTPVRARESDYWRSEASIPFNAMGTFEVTPSIIIQP